MTLERPGNALEVSRVSAAFQFRGISVRALDSVDLGLKEGEFFVLLGPSGCGKTTMLRSIAGLQRPDSGTIRIGDQTVFSRDRNIFIPPERRPIAMVFQSYAIWPHMNVFENIAFPLRDGVQRLEKDDVSRRVNEVLATLGLDSMADRPVTTLSGGQQQRVALARALALRPKVLLMDEPLSNLDYKLQVRLRIELRELMHRLRLTTVYVTHNQSEAIEIGDRIAVMDHGRFVQVGSAHDIYRYPSDEFVARFIGEMNLLSATVKGTRGDKVALSTAAGTFLAEGGGVVPPRGSRYLLGVRPEDIVLVDDTDASDTNLVKGTVTSRRFTGDAMQYLVETGDMSLSLKLRRGVDLAAGAAVTLRLPPEFCIAVPPSHGTEDPEEHLMARTAGAGSPRPAA